MPPTNPTALAAMARRGPSDMGMQMGQEHMNQNALDNAQSPVLAGLDAAMGLPGAMPAMPTQAQGLPQRPTGMPTLGRRPY